MVLKWCLQKLIRWGTASWCAKRAAKSVTPIVFTCGHWSQTVRY